MRQWGEKSLRGYRKVDQLYVDLNQVPAELHDGLKQVSTVLPLTFGESSGALAVCFVNAAGGLSVRAADGACLVEYGERNDVFRALALIQSRLLAGEVSFEIAEKRRVAKTWVMLDASRNALLNRNAVREWLKRLALAGINGFMFYTEETYEIEGEPLFGYMRGRYTAAEIREFDDLAWSLGIEMIPCIQTIAHLQRILQYDAYVDLKDTTSVMLAGETKTEEFVETMLRAATAPYRSKRIHIGMDEAWDLGRGSYLNRNGYVEPFEIIVKHLGKVLEIARRLDLKPMMWSDMFFRALSEKHAYYDLSVEITPEIAEQIPDDVQLVYWDYYHLRQADYNGMIDKHLEMGQVPIVAPGIHAWNRFWPAYGHSEETMRNCLQSCFEKGVREVIMTVWGDDGTECDFFAALPLLQYASDIIFTGKAQPEYTELTAKGSLGIDYKAWKKAGQMDRLPFLEDGVGYPNLAKILLWEDPLYGLWQPQLDGHRLNEYYASLATELNEAAENKGDQRLRFPGLLAEVLALKADLPSILREAYLAGDRPVLEDVMQRQLPAVIAGIRHLQRFHRELWLKNYKPFGWEVLERRYGGVLATCENLEFRLGNYLAGRVEKLEELDAERVKMVDEPASLMAPVQSCSRVQSTGQIFHTVV
jgi:hypothetical protein